jgi:membrane associated rhomboid family serine protease
VIPLGAVGKRLNPPYVTLALIAINLVIYFAMLPRVASDERLLAVPGRKLMGIEMQIEMRHRGVRRVINSALGLESTSPRDHESFWWKWEEGLIVRKDDPEWIEWSDARKAYDEARHQTLHYRWGFVRDHPSLRGVLAHAFLHGSFEHVFGNMLFLWAIGATVEDAWGRRWFGLLYVVGIFGSLLGDVLGMPKGLDIPSFGASGAVAAVMGAMAVRHFRKPMRVASMLPVPGLYTIAAGWLLIPWIALQLVDSASKDAAQSGVAFGAHVAGFFVGAAFAMALRLGRVEQDKLQPSYAAEQRRRDEAEKVEMAETHFRRGETQQGIETLRAALSSHPASEPLRVRLIEALAMISRRDEARAEAIELLQALWRQGRRDEWLRWFTWLEGSVGGLPPALSHRAAPLLEAADPAGASRHYAAALQNATEDPLAVQSFKKYAEMLDRYGEGEKASRVREMAAAHERKRRDRTLR